MTVKNELVALEVEREVKAFLYREARLLDTEQWDDWLALMHEEVHYWMPGIENRRREDKLGQYSADHMAYFDDHLRDLTRRVERFKQATAWAENPPTRNVHIVSNVEVFAGENEDELVVHSCIFSVRSRGLNEHFEIAARREDVLRRVDGELKILRRKILIPNATLLCKNINTFL
ncbi:MAG: 3-phenylpropionate/cinnamic acid dioxygenase subunit beta [Alcaligenaceae bacterium]|nr:3-phenylpropionate/cinnamic acid dioxygenase subunit beta [Alcaligenaceae bacterium]